MRHPLQILSTAVRFVLRCLIFRSVLLCRTDLSIWRSPFWDVAHSLSLSLSLVRLSQSLSLICGKWGLHKLGLSDCTNVRNLVSEKNNAAKVYGTWFQRKIMQLLEFWRQQAGRAHVRYASAYTPAPACGDSLREELLLGTGLPPDWLHGTMLTILNTKPRKLKGPMTKTINKSW